MIGLAMLAIGAVLLWAAFTKRGDAIANALQLDLQKTKGDAPSTTKSGGGSAASGGSSKVGVDAGSHMGLDASGSAFVIDKPYGSMSESEKDAANRFAKQIGNLGSTA